MIFTVWIVSPAGYIHSQCFSEIALSLRDSLRELGHRCEIVTDHSQTVGKVIILGAHLLSDINHAIIYNLEQSDAISPQYLSVLKKNIVWDYSLSNIEFLKSHGVSAKHVPIGYTKSLTRIENNSKPDIDVLFFGSLNKRREELLNSLANGLNVIRVFGVYGTARDALIARSKVVVNIHFYESKIFEIVRCSYLMANRKAIVSENGKDQAEKEYYSAIAFTDYENIADTCRLYCAHDDLRENLAQKAFNKFSSVPMVELVRAAL